jgi:hypothetical protein
MNAAERQRHIAWGFNPGAGAEEIGAVVKVAEAGCRDRLCRLFGIAYP